MEDGVGKEPERFLLPLEPALVRFGHEKPDDFTLLGNYLVVLDSADPDSVNYYATMSWKDVQPGLRALNISVAWAQRGPGADNTENVDKSFGITVYTQTY